MCVDACRVGVGVGLFGVFGGCFCGCLEEGEFAVAFEASTVIENMVHHLSAEQRERLHGVIHGFPEEKRFLVENIHGEMECGEE